MLNIKNYLPKSGEQTFVGNESAATVAHLTIDSRNIMYASHSMFIALQGNMNDGHKYIAKAYDQGVRNFLVKDITMLNKYKDVNYIQTSDVVATLQHLATLHRSQFPALEVVGITGSNGKTVVKEWLSSILSLSQKVVKTPKSFNSQIGVPLSTWLINNDHQIGIFEAGISDKDEMGKLEKIIQPTIGILTNIGDAHDKNFSNRKEKLIEKLQLFEHCRCVIFNGDNDLIKETILNMNLSCELITWGEQSHNTLCILDKEKLTEKHELNFIYKEKKHAMQLDLKNEFFFENVMSVLTTALTLDLPLDKIEYGIGGLDTVDMRLQISEGQDGCLLINDAYTNDKEALQIAVPFLLKHAGRRKKILALSAFDHTNDVMNAETIQYLEKFGFDQVYLVGDAWPTQLTSSFQKFAGTDELLKFLDDKNFSDHIILIKGARKYGFEKIYQKLVRQSHSVRLDIDLAAIEHNLSVFASLLNTGTEIMPIIKASAYGTGSEEIAKLLQYKGVYALGVAFADEGAQLRKSGIIIPIVVLNADANSFDTIYHNNLELEIYAMHQLQSLIQWNNQALINKTKIHLKFDTGMSRLGFQVHEIPQLIEILKKNPLEVKTIFSHLSSSEEEGDDVFTHVQASRFNDIYDLMSSSLGYRPKRHIVNTSGIVRFPQYHYEIVRLGLGLYGIDSTMLLKSKLEKVHTLSARIIQIKTIKPGDYIGYNRRHQATSEMRIAILNIGYADGLIRLAGNSKYEVLLHHQNVPIVGNICMDLTIIDVTEVSGANVGDEVIVFGKNHPIEQLASVCQTIPYEILCRIAPRIKREYIN